MENRGGGRKIGGRQKDEVEKEAQEQEERRWCGGWGIGRCWEDRGREPSTKMASERQKKERKKIERGWRGTGEFRIEKAIDSRSILKKELKKNSERGGGWLRGVWINKIRQWNARMPAHITPTQSSHWSTLEKGGLQLSSRMAEIKSF